MFAIVPATVSSMNENAIEVMAAVIKAKGVVIDDHGNGDRTLTAVAASYFLSGDVMYVVPHTKGPHCLNKLYLDQDGQVHVSRMSVGGTVHPERHDSIKDAIAAYNEGSVAAAQFGGWGELSGTVTF